MTAQPTRRRPMDAMARIDKHEEICAIRYTQIGLDISEINRKLDQALKDKTIMHLT